MYGGGQERGKRPTTYNHVGIIGLGKALELAIKDMDRENARQIKMRDALIEGIMGSIEDVKLNGHRTKRLPNNVNLSFHVR